MAVSVGAGECGGGAIAVSVGVGGTGAWVGRAPGLVGVADGAGATVRWAMGVAEGVGLATVGELVGLAVAAVVAQLGRSVAVGALLSSGWLTVGEGVPVALGWRPGTSRVGVAVGEGGQVWVPVGVALPPRARTMPETPSTSLHQPVLTESSRVEPTTRARVVNT
ncbi:MAG: hypothetical protein ACOYEW_03445 [Anaerolineae bacterium]